MEVVKVIKNAEAPLVYMYIFWRHHEFSSAIKYVMLSQVTVFKALHALCQRLPKEEASECESQVKIYLPKILQQTSSQWVSLTSPHTCFCMYIS